MRNLFLFFLSFLSFSILTADPETSLIKCKYLQPLLLNGGETESLGNKPKDVDVKVVEKTPVIKNMLNSKSCYQYIVVEEATTRNSKYVYLKSSDFSGCWYERIEGYKETSKGNGLLISRYICKHLGWDAL